MSAPTQAVRDVVYARAGYRCERCGGNGPEFSVHHRRPRGMGGTKRPESNAPPNLLLLCVACHGRVESHRAAALLSGHIVAQHQDPAGVSVLIHGVRLVLLAPDGSYADVAAGVES